MSKISKRTQPHQIFWCGNFVRQKLCENCVIPQNFQNRKVGEISVFHAVQVLKIYRKETFSCIFSFIPFMRIPRHFQIPRQPAYVP